MSHYVNYGEIGTQYNRSPMSDCSKIKRYETYERTLLSNKTIEHKVRKMEGRITTKCYGVNAKAGSHMQGEC